MHTDIIPLREDSSAVRLEAYWLNDSPEYQTGQPRPAIIVCPGGGYTGLSDREAEPIALRFLAHGCHAFVLRYSVQTRLPAPMLDLARAVALLRRNSHEWLVDPNRVAVCGFSAGGHLAASLGVFWDKRLIFEPLGLSPEQIRPNALVLCYAAIELESMSNRSSTVDAGGQPVYDSQDMMVALLGDTRPSQARRDQYRLDLHVSPVTPPAFIWHTANDQLIPAHNALRFASALARHNVPYELHIFENGVHGLALADEVTDVHGQFINPDNQIWIELALRWLKHERG